MSTYHMVPIWLSTWYQAIFLVVVLPWYLPAAEGRRQVLGQVVGAVGGHVRDSGRSPEARPSGGGARMATHEGSGRRCATRWWAPRAVIGLSLGALVAAAVPLLAGFSCNE